MFCCPNVWHCNCEQKAIWKFCVRRKVEEKKEPRVNPIKKKDLPRLGLPI